jgi:hypothetical protein
MRANGGLPVPLSANKDHIGDANPSVFNPSVHPGRMDLADLEYAMLADIGWSVATRARPSFYRRWDLFLGGEEGEANIQIHPDRGVYLMQVDVLKGAVLSLSHSSGPGHEGVHFRLFDSSGKFMGGGGNGFAVKFGAGGTYYVAVAIDSNSHFTFDNPGPAIPGAPSFSLQAHLVQNSTDLAPYEAYYVEDQDRIRARSFESQGSRFDDDFYSVEMTAGDLLSLSTSPSDGGGLTGPNIVSVYDNRGVRIGQSDATSDYGMLSLIAPYTGIYYVLIADTAGPANTPVIDPHPGLGGGGGSVRYSASSDGEYLAWIAIGSGSEYKLRVTTTPPPPPIPPPQPTGISFAKRRGLIQSFSVGFSHAMDAATFSRDAFRITLAGRDKKFGTRDDKAVKVKNVAYDPTNRTVHLQPKGPSLSARSRYQLTILDGYLKGSDGKTLDGDRNGTPGGPFVATT